MKKYVFLTLCSVTMFTLVGMAQVPSLGGQVQQDNKAAADANEALKVAKGKYQEPEEKTETVDVTAITNSAFTASNTFDGTSNSYKHAQRVNVTLQTSGRLASYQLVFYSQNELMPVSANVEAGAAIAYYPMSMYDDIKQKLEQSLAARKKVQLKVVQKKDGFREATLLF